jgi:hypothetical protein
MMWQRSYPGGAVTQESGRVKVRGLAMLGVGSSQSCTTLLELWRGGLLLVAYGGVFAFVGTWLAVRRGVS